MVVEPVEEESPFEMAGTYICALLQKQLHLTAPHAVMTYTPGWFVHDGAGFLFYKYCVPHDYKRQYAQIIQPSIKNTALRTKIRLYLPAVCPPMTLLFPSQLRHAR